MLVTALARGAAGRRGRHLPRGVRPKNWFTDVIEINISNLAGVPSIIYGLMALGLFVYQLRSRRRASLAGGLTLALLILPIVIVATREALRADAAVRSARRPTRSARRNGR